LRKGTALDRRDARYERRVIRGHQKTGEGKIEIRPALDSAYTREDIKKKGVTIVP